MRIAVEEKAAQVVKDWVDRFYDMTVNDKALDEEYEDKLGEPACCYVGDFRARIGLSTRYFLTDEENYCGKCYIFSIALHHIKYNFTRNRNSYLYTLSQFLEHMMDDHGWKPTTVSG